MHPELKSWLLYLMDDVQRRHARTGDSVFDTLFIAYHELTSAAPSYRYVENVVGTALGVVALRQAWAC